MNITENHADLLSHHIYVYNESSSDVPKTELWKEVANVRALSLPMGCTLTNVNAYFYFIFLF